MAIHLARVILALTCILMTTARCHQNVSSVQGIHVSVDCSIPQGHVNITVAGSLPPVQCPDCNCPAQQCPRYPTRVPLPPVKLATPTASGYEFFPGLGHYKFHAYGATWQQARQRCNDEGTHLVIVNSQREAHMIVALFERYPTMAGAEQTGWAWTEVHENGDNGNYVTLSGEPLNATGFAIWSPKEPNDLGLNDCVLTNRNNAYLADAGCKRVFAFICELEL